jgi:hypothetical protein
MKKEIVYLSVVLLFAACSSRKMATTDDNVYESNARAKEYQPYVRPIVQKQETPVENTYATEEDIRYTNDYDYRYDDISFSSRLDRFHNYSPWRNYYDSWYDYRYDPYAFRSPWSWNVYIGPSYGWNFGYNPWDYNPYRYRWGNYWGMYSYYNPLPYYPGFYNGNYPSISYPYNPRTYRPKPGRGGDSMNPNFGTGGNAGINGSRADRYNGGTPANPPRAGGSIAGPRPDRSGGSTTPPDQTRSKPADSGQQARPARTERPSTPPSTPPASSGGRSDSNNSARPARARDGK